MTQLSTTNLPVTTPLTQSTIIIRNDKAQINSLIEAEHNDDGTHNPIATKFANTLASPATNNLIYDTTSQRLQYWNGSAWTHLNHRNPIVTNMVLGNFMPASYNNGLAWTIINGQQILPANTMMSPDTRIWYIYITFDLTFQAPLLVSGYDFSFTSPSGTLIIDKSLSFYVTIFQALGSLSTVGFKVGAYSIVNNIVYYKGNCSVVIPFQALNIWSLNFYYSLYAGMDAQTLPGITYSTTQMKYVQGAVSGNMKVSLNIL